MTGRDASALTSDGDKPRSVDDIVGPMQREAMKRSTSREIAPKDEKDHAALKVAQKQFDDGEYALASKGFSTIVRKRKTSKFQLFGDSAKDRPTYDPIREEAVFYLAESQFMQKTLADAASNYQLLIKDYPSTRFMDESTRRLFEISRTWLGVDGFATTEEIRQVNLENGADSQPLSSKKATKGFSLIPNLSDSSRPVFDQNGHALKALKTIWLSDPSGPLADDALMLAATHYVRNEEYREADRLFTILREQFSKSPHLQNAFVLGSHVKLMSYQGAAYDEQLLLDAKELKEQTLRLFRDLPEGDRVRRELKAINEAEARREWELAVFYEKKRKPQAVRISCQEILAKYPESAFAAPARAKLAAMGITVGGDAQTEPTTIPMSPTQELPVESRQPFQQIPEIRDRLPDSQDQQVFPSRKPIFDDDPITEATSDVGRTRL
ncbi:MAG: outer membrane protein assembly factor BamD [Planctomycetota bacterium]|nr:outer membrane protein assembly factor BamD [Planctomycetota bacterium]